MIQPGKKLGNGIDSLIIPFCGEGVEATTQVQHSTVGWQSSSHCLPTTFGSAAQKAAPTQEFLKHLVVDAFLR